MESLGELYTDGTSIEVVESVIEVETGAEVGVGVGGVGGVGAVSGYDWAVGEEEEEAEECVVGGSWADLEEAVEAVRAARESEKITSFWPEAPMAHLKQVMSKTHPQTLPASYFCHQTATSAPVLLTRRPVAPPPPPVQTIITPSSVKASTSWAAAHHSYVREEDIPPSPPGGPPDEPLNLLAKAADTVIRLPQPPKGPLPPRARRRVVVKEDSPPPDPPKKLSRTVAEEDSHLRRSVRPRRQNPRYEADESSAPWACPDCSRRFHHRQELCDHSEAAHAPAAPRLFCQLCGEGFRRAAERRSHLFACHRQELPACPHCGLELLSHPSLAVHIRSAHPNKPLVEAVPLSCEVCGLIAGEMGSLRRHMSREHPSLPFTSLPPIFACQWCERSFDAEASLVAHEAAAHADADLLSEQSDLPSDLDEAEWDEGERSEQDSDET